MPRLLALMLLVLAACSTLPPPQKVPGVRPVVHDGHAKKGVDTAVVLIPGALASIEGDWTPEELSAFLENPKGYAPGTSMGFAGLRKVEDRADVIAHLQSGAN